MTNKRDIGVRVLAADKLSVCRDHGIIRRGINVSEAIRGEVHGSVLLNRAPLELNVYPRVTRRPSQKHVGSFQQS